eukprot:1151230-Pelagomonas_calceolata.AAC.1
MSACLGVSATRARAWAAGGVETNMQQIIPNFQEGSVWTCKPIVGAWKGRYAWASAAQFLACNSAATQFFIALSMQMDGELKKEQIDTLSLGRGAVFGGKGNGWSFWASCP